MLSVRLLLYLYLFTGVLIIEPQRSLITQNKNEERLRDENEKDRGNRQRQEAGINREKSDPFAAEILNITIPDTTSSSRNCSKH